jgi:translocation protein SEC62
MYAGNKFWANVATGAVIAIVIGFTLLPIWPEFAKKILWYCSVTFLIATLAFCLVRFVLFLVLWLMGYEFWIFPRLFDESLSFQDSFKPIYTFEKGTVGQGYYRIGMMIALGGFVYWACTQPTEFDGFIKAQREFIDDIYSGNLLADVAHDHHQTLDRTRGRVFDLEALLREMAEEEKAAIEASKEGSDIPDVNSPLGDSSSSADDDEAADQAQRDVDDKLLEELLAKEEADESSERNSL